MVAVVGCGGTAAFAANGGCNRGYLRRGRRCDLTTCRGGLRLRTPLMGLQLIYSMSQRTDELVTFFRAPLQRINAPHQLFHGGFLLLCRRRLR